MIFGDSQALGEAPEADSGLLTRARQGDASALTAIFHAYSARLIALCFHILHDRPAAEDAAAEVFLRLKARLSLYDPSIPFERWLFRIAANQCIDVLRRRKLEDRWMTEPAFIPSPPASPLSLLLIRERREAAARAVQSLPEAYRLPLVLRYFGDLTYEEIAAELSLEKSQVAGRIFRAKQMLRTSLQEHSA